MNKANLSQRKLDSFAKSICNSNMTVSLSKLSDKSLDKFTPAKKDSVTICSSSEKDDKTPSGQLRGTPVKCRLVLTPIKSPYRGGISRSPAHRKSGVNKTEKTMVIEDDTNDVIITGCKSPKINSGKKIKKSPRSGKTQKTLGGTEDSNKKNLKGGTISKKLDLLKSVTADNVKEKELIKEAGSKDTKIPKPESLVQKGELLNVDSDSDKDFESSPRKVNSIIWYLIIFYSNVGIDFKSEPVAKIFSSVARVEDLWVFKDQKTGLLIIYREVTRPTS